MSDDHVKLVVEQLPTPIEDNRAASEMYESLLHKEFAEGTTNVSTLWDALSSFGDEEIISVGICPKQADGAALIQIRSQSGTIVLLAGMTVVV
jgi:hypothetical protein